MHDVKGNKVGQGNPVQEIVRLSTRYGIMSKHTAFVAVEERDTPTEGTMQVRKVPTTFGKRRKYIYCSEIRDLFLKFIFTSYPSV